MKKGYKIIFIRPENSITDISKDTIIVFMTWNKKKPYFLYCLLEMVQLRITYISCSYIFTEVHIFPTNLHTCSQNLIANCPVLGLVGMRPRPPVLKIFFFFLRYAIFLARLNNFQSVSICAHIFAEF